MRKTGDRLLIQITAPHFCAGLIPGLLVPPILRYMREWSPEKIESYCRRKGWRYTVVEVIRE